MNKPYAIAALAILSFITTPTQAQDWPELNKENVGKGVGAVTGAIIGSNIGGGRGRTAAIAAGTLAGFWAGGKVGSHFTEKPHKGAKQTNSRPSSSRDSNRSLKPALDRLPPIELVNAYYLPTTDINVRGGPGIDFKVLHTLQQGKSVPVVGKVVDSDWYLIAEQGKASGFLYAPLMTMDHQQSVQSNAIRDASGFSQPVRYITQNSNCRTINQATNPGNGTSRPLSYKACQQADGSWVKI